MKWDEIIEDKISKDIFADSIKKLNNKNVLIIISKTKLSRDIILIRNDYR